MKKFLVVLLVLSVSLLGFSTLKVGVNVFGMANFFARAIYQAMIEEVEAFGAEAIPTVTPDVTSRMNAIEDYISKGVDIIVFSQGDVNMVKPALAEAKRAGIILVSADAGYCEFIDAAVESNNWVMGAMAGTALINLINAKGNVVEIYNDLGQMIRMRTKMFETMLTEYQEVKIVSRFVYAWPGYFPDVKAKMESVLQKYPNPGDIVGVFAPFDGAGVAAAQAIEEAGLADHIVVVGIDGDPQAFEAMKKGGPFKATVVQDPEGIGQTAVRTAFKLYEGGKIDGKYIYVPSRLVTQQEVINGEASWWEEKVRKWQEQQ